MKEIIKELVEQYCDEIDENSFDNIVYEALEKSVFDELLSIFEEAKISVPAEIIRLPHDFLIDMTQTPYYLRSAHFVAWLKKFNQLLEKIGLPEWKLAKLNLSVEFSDDIKKKRYGSLSIEELKEIIRNTWGTSAEINAILEKIKSNEDYRKLIQDLMGAIREIREIENNVPNPEDLYSYLEELEFEVPILGRYFHDDKLIVLYTKNIEKAAVEHKNSFSREIEKVFVHELFHAYHYKDDENELVCRSDYTAKVVKESLASAFEWCYCIGNGIAGADDLEKTWDEYSVFCYPYSGAKNLLAYKGTYTLHRNLEEAKFCKVFNKSLKDMDGALRELLYSNDFYRIKNAVQIHEKKVIQRMPVFTATTPNVFKINSGKSFHIESKGGYIFAPADNRHKEMTNVRTGDILLQIFGGKLHAISLVTNGCYYASSAHGQTASGYYADVTYMVPDEPIDILQFKNDLSYPIRRNEPYIRSFNYPDFARLILKELQKKYPHNEFCIALISTLIS